MPSLLWPTTLPPLQSEESEFGRKDNVIRTTMDDGTEKVRIATTRAIETFTTTLEFNGEQLEDFLAFLDDGARVLPFEWVDYLTDEPVMVKFRSLPEKWTMVMAAPDPDDRIYRGQVTCEVVGPVV